MANKSKRKIRPRRRNPMERVMTRPPRPKITFDGQEIMGTSYIALSSTGAGVFGDFFALDSSNAGFFRAIATMISNYAEYTVTQASVEFIPTNGPSSIDAGGRVHMAWVDNPEKIGDFAGAALAATKISYIKSCNNVVTRNLWERFTYNIPLTYRRKTFDTNNTIVTYTDVNEVNRSTQGVLMIGIESPSAVAATGTIVCRGRVKVKTLSYAFPT